MEKKKCYIAGKISNLPKEVYEANFRGAAAEVRALGYEPVLPIDLPHDHDKSWEAHMKEDLRAMLECDALYALENWKDSKGANIELRLAQNVGINVLFQKYNRPETII